MGRGREWGGENSTQFTEPELSANLWLIDRLRPIAARNGKTLPQLAIAWTLRRPEMTAAIAGARKPSQIEEKELIALPTFHFPAR